MYECFTSFLMTEHLRDATLDPPLGPAGYPRQLDPLRQPFPTADGHIAIVPYTPAATTRLLDLIGSGDFLARPENVQARAEGRLMPLVWAETARQTPGRTTAEWLALFAQNDIPAMRAADLGEVIADPHFAATGFFRRREHPVVGPMHEMRPPVRYGADPDRTLGFAPALGADGDAVRADLSQRRSE